MDVPAKIGNWWLVITAEEVDVCDFDPGYAVAVSVTGILRRMCGVTGWRMFASDEGGESGAPAFRVQLDSLHLA